MKLIRTLIETKRSETGAVAPTRAATRTPASTMPRLRNSVPISDALKARSVLSDGLERRLREFKTDLVELAPRKMVDDTGKKPKRVWDMDAEEAEEKTAERAAERARTQQAKRRQPDTLDDVPTVPLPPQADDNRAAPKDPTTEVATQPNSAASGIQMFEVPPPLQPHRPLTIGRKKTRIMGFCEDAPADLFDMTGNDAAPGLEFPVGWIVIMKGPGRGTAFVLQNPVSSIGRGADQTITLNFGDDTISRQNHAAVAYDDHMNACFLGFGGKANLVRLNGRPVLGTEQLTHGDVIRVGQTDLKFIGLCGPDFSWQDDEDGQTDD
ncbi:MAG: FHA domain-containing protein [Pseudomonadota bacterium]